MDLTTEHNTSHELDFSLGNLVWSYFPDSMSNEKDGYPFSSAPPQVHFSNPRHQLQIYQSIPEDKNIVKIGLNALIALSINDFASSSGNSGGMLLPTPNVKKSLAKIIFRQAECVTAGATTATTISTRIKREHISPWAAGITPYQENGGLFIYPGIDSS